MNQAPEGMIGEIRMFAGNFAPRGWALCEGQLISISQNPALFSIIGTNYGGDGRTSFGLPDLRGRVPIGSGAPVVSVGNGANQLVSSATTDDDQFVDNMQPTQTVNFIICLYGFFPSRS